MQKTIFLSALLLAIWWAMPSCASDVQPSTNDSQTLAEMTTSESIPPAPQASPGDIETITLGAGCFWCVEAVFTELAGVKSVVSGYCNGEVKNPTYKEVCTGNTGHAEVAQITYDPSVITFDELLEVFWQTHDPTTLNQQGADRGTQYRSGVYYHTEYQRDVATAYKAKLDASGAWDNPIVTEIEPIENYSAAENYHQEYFANNPEQGYCRYVIQPKVEKFRKVFKDKLKK